MHRNLLCDSLEIKTAFPSQLIDSYCWPRLATKFLKGYNGYYIKDESSYKKDESEWIMIVKGNKNQQEMIYNEMFNFHIQKEYQYRFDNYSEKYFNGECNIYICGTISEGDNLRKSKQWLINLFNDYYNHKNDMIIETIW